MAYSLAREIPAKRIFQKRYKRPYHIFISREHINLPWEVLGEIAPYFDQIHSTYFPVPLKFEFCNLFIGANYRPKAQPDQEAIESASRSMTRREAIKTATLATAACATLRNTQQSGRRWGAVGRKYSAVGLPLVL